MKTYQHSLAILFFLLFSTLKTQAQLTVSAADTAYCVGSFTTLYAHDSAATSYLWSPAGILTNDTADTVQAFPSDTTTFQVISFQNGLPLDTASITINVTPFPTVSVNNINRSVCKNDTIRLIGSGADNYTWSGASFFLSSNSGGSVVFNGSDSSGFHQVNLTGSVGGCSDMITLNVRIDTLIPELSFAPIDTFVCQGASATLQLFGASQYAWTDPTGTLDTLQGNSVTATPSSLTNMTNYTVIGSTQACSTEVNVSLQAVPQAQFSYSRTSNGIPICRFGRDTVTFSGNTVRYELDFPGGVAHSQQNQTVLAPTQDYVLDVTGYTEYNCSSIQSINVSIDTSCVDSAYYVSNVAEIDDFSRDVKVISSPQGFNIQSERDLVNTQVVVFDAMGRVVLEKQITGPTYQISFEQDFQSGVYIVHLKQENSVAVKKLFLND